MHGSKIGSNRTRFVFLKISVINAKVYIVGLMVEVGGDIIHVEMQVRMNYDGTETR